MEFESPDVEKEFPGLYASDTGKKSESDFSDDAVHEKHSKKELLGKKKDKKDKKDRGYATLEGESSADEEETKSPSKSKSKTKAFKFPNIGEEEPIFGVSLHLAVERSRCHDGVKLPLVVRDCIDYLEEYGMSVEGLYKVAGNKSKVQHLKKVYNQRESVNMSDFEPTVATSLLLLFIKELPEPVLESSELISRFEQAASAKELAQRECQLAELINKQLSVCNRELLAWITLHLDHVITCEKTTKMNAQTIAMTLSPALQMSHRLLLALLLHCKALFPGVQLTKYVPPLPAGSTKLPETAEGILAELAKQESLLSQIHMLMNAGYVNKSREEQLWEVQRMITQLKRKYKMFQKLEGSTQKSLDEEVVKSNDECQVRSLDSQSNKVLSNKDENERLKISETSRTARRASSEISNSHVPINEKDAVDKSRKLSTGAIDNKTEASQIGSEKSEEQSPAAEPGKLEEPPVENEIDRLRESLIYEELLNMQASLRMRILQERHGIERLNQLLAERVGTTKQVTMQPLVNRSHSPTEAEMTAMIQLVNENQLLEKKMTTLIRSIVEEYDTCVELRVQLALHHQLMAQKNQTASKQI
ncbi:hypothetical protein QAD02_023077 [Eretmocerus hayati]|uniref:Uncharacterized protein n=1 Tax=Eretmocerus hayati TaxID=131215 RepID=A0ACC2PWF4_9HYME|nr:hypothetical protein QAD02_023077 [Eretmocerus hayati]